MDYDYLPGFRTAADGGAIAQRAQNPAATMEAFPPGPAVTPTPSWLGRLADMPVAPGRTLRDVFSSEPTVDVATGAPRAAPVVAAPRSDDPMRALPAFGNAPLAADRFTPVATGDNVKMVKTVPLAQAEAKQQAAATPKLRDDLSLRALKQIAAMRPRPVPVGDQILNEVYGLQRQAYETAKQKGDVAGMQRSLNAITSLAKPNALQQQMLYGNALGALPQYDEAQ